MNRLVAWSLRMFLVRLVRSVGYAGPRPLLVVTLLCGAVVWLDLLGGAWVRSQVAGQIRYGLGHLMVALLVQTTFFIAGPALLLSELVRDRGSRLAAALASLPLTTREIGLVTWLPGFVASLGLLALLLIPSVMAFQGVGYGLSLGLQAASVSALAGFSLAAVTIVLVRVVMQSDRWAGTRIPVMMLIWCGLCGVESWQAGLALISGQLTVPVAVFLGPLITMELTAGRFGELWLLLLLIVALAGLLVLLLSWSATAGRVARLRPLLWNWRSHWRPPLATAEAVRFLRSGTMLANWAAGEVISLAIILGLARLPMGMRSMVAPLLIPAVVGMVCLPAILLRGTTRLRLPVPLMLGYRPRVWAAAQSLAGLVLLVAGLLPPIVELVVLGVSPELVISLALPFAVMAVGIGLALGWLLPATSDNPMAQVVNALMYLIGVTAVAVVVDRVLPSPGLAWSLTMITFGLVAMILTLYVEERRWRRRFLNQESGGT